MSLQVKKVLSQVQHVIGGARAAQSVSALKAKGVVLFQPNFQTSVCMVPLDHPQKGTNMNFLRVDSVVLLGYPSLYPLSAPYLNKFHCEAPDGLGDARLVVACCRQRVGGQ
eukprot:4587857-Amphidinium_carterae.2